MIKLKLLVEDIQDFVKQMHEKYPVAGPEVDGREVLDKIDNTSSISASLYKWYILPDIREIPMTEFAEISTKHYSVQGTNWIAELARRIEETKTIMPLIMVVDQEGPYILEGSNRIKALKIIGAKSFPALVVVDTEKI